MRTLTLALVPLVSLVVGTAGCVSHRPFAEEDAGPTSITDGGDAGGIDRLAGDGPEAPVTPSSVDAADAAAKSDLTDVAGDQPRTDALVEDSTMVDAGGEQSRSDGGAGDRGGLDSNAGDQRVDAPPPRAAVLTIDPMSFTFGPVELGATAVCHSFTILNGGDLPAGTGSRLAAAANGANPLDFTVSAGSSTCADTLGGGDSCQIVVCFAPTVDGNRAVSLSVSGTPGGLVSASLDGLGVRPPAISASAMTMNFANVEIGVQTATQTWAITNNGGASTGAVAFTNDNPSEAIVTNNCAGPLAGGEQCTIVVAVKAADGGPRRATLAVTASRGGSASLAVTAYAGYRISVNIAGAGTVIIQPGATTCTTSCSVVLDRGTTVILQARPSNGSDFIFAGWSTPGCLGPINSCTKTLASSIGVTATFAPANNNLIFVSASSFPTNRGSAAAYDADCNSAATAAGINNANGNAYVALTSDAASLARERLGTARGWVRMDGRPFSDTVSGLFDSNQVFNSVRYDERGDVVGPLATLMTGTRSSGGMLDQNCQSWTSSSDGSVLCGNAEGGPSRWTDLGASCRVNCNGGPYRLICMGKTKSSPVTITPATGRLIWLDRNIYMAGSVTPEVQCQSEKPSGVTAASALLAYSTRGPSAVLSPTMNYIRPDGILVGSGAQIADGMVLESGIWQGIDGTYRTGGGAAGRAFTGGAGLDVSKTCGDWTSGAGMGVVGDYGLTAPGAWWSSGTAACNGAPFWYYCVQTAP